MPNEEETYSTCGLKPVAMFATMIKEKFKDDDFLAGTCGFVWGYYRFVFFILNVPELGRFIFKLGVPALGIE